MLPALDRRIPSPSPTYAWSVTSFTHIVNASLDRVSSGQTNVGGHPAGHSPAALKGKGEGWMTALGREEEGDR